MNKKKRPYIKISFFLGYLTCIAYSCCSESQDTASFDLVRNLNILVNGPYNEPLTSGPKGNIAFWDNSFLFLDDEKINEYQCQFDINRIHALLRDQVSEAAIKEDPNTAVAALTVIIVRKGGMFHWIDEESEDSDKTNYYALSRMLENPKMQEKYDNSGISQNMVQDIKQDIFHFTSSVDLENLNNLYGDAQKRNIELLPLDRISPKLKTLFIPIDKIQKLKAKIFLSYIDKNAANFPEMQNLISNIENQILQYNEMLRAILEDGALDKSFKEETDDIISEIKKRIPSANTEDCKEYLKKNLEEKAGY